METNIKLVDELNILSKQKVFVKDIPDFVLKNLNRKFVLREYQKEAIARFRYYLTSYEGRKTPAHLLFHMATGSGKTLLMSADILYLYSLGYRNFIFFVNSTNIIKKTQSNFLDKASSKYLFAEKIVFQDEEIEVKEVENFEATNTDNINIIFTTIQGLHSRLNTPQENAITYEDFKDIKIAFLSDEAHHINTLTKSKLDKEEADETASWEQTVQKAFRANNQNIMLEYTATVEISHSAVARKYADKIIYEYTLKNFREDGFSKEVEILQSDLDVEYRALQAVILSQYRRKVAEKHKIQLKPVILFKSKQIKDSEKFEQDFYELIKGFHIADFKRVLSGSTGIMEQAVKFFIDNKITPVNLIKEIQEDFAKEKCLIINSKADSEEKQIKVNTLEDYNNETRIIFTTNMLNEGWDVLNLFDIVRLYETRDAKAGKAGSTTISEAQLIGRGARYFPFLAEKGQEKDKRKYDEDLENELRVLEELHYHSLTDSRYIAELRNELVKSGIAPDNRITKRVSIKPEIMKTPFWNNGLVFLNKQVKRDYSSVKSLKDIIQDTLFKYRLKSGKSSEAGIFDEQANLPASEELKKKTIKLNTLDRHILRKAADKVDFFYFANLCLFFPNLKSIEEFISSKEYTGLIDVELSAKNGRLDNLTNQDKFDIALEVLKELASKIQVGNKEYIGTKEFYGEKVKVLAKTKTLEILIGGADKEYGKGMNETLNDDLRMDLSTQDWYLYDENYGTSEEKYFIQFIRQAMDELKKKYQQVYLLRNERLFKIYRFSDGQAIEPDFVLFLKERGGKKTLSFQLFVEPKGNRGLIEDKWKEDFLKEIENEFKIENLFDKDGFKLIGLPFYNEEQKQEFSKVFKEKLNI